MTQLLWRCLLASSVVFGVNSLISSAVALSIETPNLPESTQVQKSRNHFTGVEENLIQDASPKTAGEIVKTHPIKVAQTEPSNLSPSSADSLDISPISDVYSLDNTESSESVDSSNQVTSVSQLTDVQPTDWAFQALQSLVERYGCIEGYPDRTFRGNRAMTRYEFAAGLNKCLDRIQELIAALPQGVTKEDLATIQRLQEQFATELASLRFRVDSLEARTQTLERQQFSATTKLNAVATFAFAGVFKGQGPQNSIPPFSEDGTNPYGSGRKIPSVPEFGSRVRLNFLTSFTGTDRLVTRLEATNLTSLGRTTLTPEGSLAFADPEASNNVALADLYYVFNIGQNTSIYLAANAVGADDFMSTLNPFLDVNGNGGSLTSFGTRNSIYYLADNAGLGILHSFSDKLVLSAGYLAGDGVSSPLNKNGLFNGSYGAIAQLTFKPVDQLTFGVIYANAYKTDFTSTGNPVGSTNANLYSAVSPFGLATVFNSYSVAASWQVSRNFLVNGWVGYTDARVLKTGNGQIWDWAVTVALPDLFKEGNLGGFVFGMEPKLTQLDKSVTQATNGVVTADRNTSFHVEAFYTYQLNHNIGITPGLIWLTAPNHDARNDGILIGTVRATFTF